jgi:hypothetical protein
MDPTAREVVRRRAADRCEYCHLPAAHVVTPFQIEHVVARQHGGRDALGNLAYACLRCNLHKGPNLSGLDPTTQRITTLFHPRRHKWDRHFGWAGAQIVGKTAVGRTTVAVLAMNDPERVALRQELLAQGLLPTR